MWWSFYSLFAISTLIMIAALFEFFYLKGLSDISVLKKISVLTGILFLAASYAVSMGYIHLSILIIPVLIIFSLIVFFFLVKEKSVKKNTGILLTAIFYIILPLCILPFLASQSKNNSYQPALIISILAILWCYDSFAYLTGVAIGKHKMFPSLSPKKTWEGFIGGSIFAILTALIISHFNKEYTTIQWIVISMIIVITGTTGDFFESSMKRKAGVKDSGNWLPGHGGILDRFDSFLFVIPFVFIFVYLFTNLL